MEQYRYQRSLMAIAVFGAMGVFEGVPAQAQTPKELPAVNVSGERDTRTVPLDVPASTGSRLRASIKEIPASVEVINQDTMQARGDRTMLEAVTKAAGINGGRVGTSHIGLAARGFIENGVTWLYNGVRVPGGSNMSSRTLDTANFDRIEVIRGPASVLNGEGGTGATINLISRTPSFAVQPYELDYSFGSYNSHRLHAGAGGAIKDDVMAYRLDLSANRYGSQVQGERGTLERLTGSVLFKISPSLKLTLELDKMRDDVDDFYNGTPLVNGNIDRSLRRINYNNLTDNVYKSDTTWLRANIEWQATPNVEVRNYTYYYDSFRDFRDVSGFTFNPGAVSTVTRIFWGDIDHDHQLLGNRLEGLFKGKIGGLDNRFLIGMDVNRTDFKTQRNGFPGLDVVDAYNPPSLAFSAGTNINKSPARDVSIDQWSVFLEDQLSLTKQFKLVGGLRHDHFKTEWIYLDQAGAPRETKSHTFNSWRGGAVYDVTPNTALYASYATAVEPGGTLLLLNRNQSQLDLTTAKQLEVGLKQSFWGTRGEWTLAAYEIKKRNVFVPDPARPTNRLPVGKQSSKGVELTLGLRPTQHWQIDGNVAYVDARYDEFSVGSPPVSLNGNRPRFAPQWMANLGVQYKPTAQWTFGAWARHVDKAYINDQNNLEVPSFTTLDLSANYAHSKALDVGVRVRNVTDELYAEAAAGTTQVLIANPRTYELTLRMKF